MKRIALATVFFLTSGLMRAMNTHEITSVDELPALCLAIDKKLSEQPEIGTFSGPIKRLHMQNVGEMILFTRLLKLVDTLLANVDTSWVNLRRGLELVYASQSCCIAYDFEAHVIECHLNPLANNHLMHRDRQSAYQEVLENMKSGWALLDVWDLEKLTGIGYAGGLPGKAEECLCLKKRQNIPQPGSHVSESDAEDLLLCQLIREFNLSEKVVLEMGAARRVFAHDHENRYLIVRKDAWREFQACFGFDVLGINRFDDVSELCLALEDALRSQPVFEGRDSHFAGTRKILPMLSKKEWFLFGWWQMLAAQFLPGGLLHVAKVVAQLPADGAGTYKAGIGLIEQADDTISLDVLEHAYSKVLKSLKSGWFLVELNDVSGMPHLNNKDEWIVLYQAISSNKTRLSEIENDVISAMLDSLNTEKKVVFKTDCSLRESPQQYRSLFIHQDALEEFQAFFGFDVPVLQRAFAQLPRVPTPMPIIEQATPLHVATAAQPRAWRRFLDQHNVPNV